MSPVYTTLMLTNQRHLSCITFYIKLSSYARKLFQNFNFQNIWHRNSIPGKIKINHIRVILRMLHQFISGMAYNMLKGYEFCKAQIIIFNALCLFSLQFVQNISLQRTYVRCIIFFSRWYCMEKRIVFHVDANSAYLSWARMLSKSTTAKLMLKIMKQGLYL